MITEKKSRNFINASLILGLISISIFIIGTIVTMLLVEDHDFIRDVISVMGHDNPYAWFFNSTLIISGILMIPAFPAIYFVMRDLDNSKPKLLLTILITGTLIGPFVSFAGIFNEGDFFVIHITFAVGAYLFVIVTAFCWGILVWKLDADHPYKNYKIWRLDISVNFIIIACMFAYAFTMIFFQDFIWATLGILEKSTIYAFFIYFIIVIARILKMLRQSKVIS